MNLPDSQINVDFVLVEEQQTCFQPNNYEKMRTRTCFYSVYWIITKAFDYEPFSVVGCSVQVYFSVFRVR